MRSQCPGFMRKGNHGEFPAAMESLLRRVVSFIKAMIYRMQYLERVGVISPNHRELLLWLPI